MVSLTRAPRRSVSDDVDDAEGCSRLILSYSRALTSAAKVSQASSCSATAFSLNHVSAQRGPPVLGRFRSLSWEVPTKAIPSGGPSDPSRNAHAQPEPRRDAADATEDTLWAELPDRVVSVRTTARSKAAPSGHEHIGAAQRRPNDCLLYTSPSPRDS